MLLNNDRLSHWLAGAFLTWALIFLIWAFPIFHWWLDVPTVRIATYIGLCCVVQLAVTPWLFTARATRENPCGLVGQRAGALIIFFSVIGLLFFSFLHRLNLIAITVVVAYAAVCLVIAGVLSRHRRVNRGGS